MSGMNGAVDMSGRLSLAATRGGNPPVKRRRRPSVFWWQVRQRLLYRWREIPLCLVLFLLPLLRRFAPGLNVLCGATYLKARIDGQEIDFGLAGRHLVVTAGKNYVAGCFDGTNTVTLLKFHGFGTGATAAAAGDTALQTEFTTQYAVASTRPTGSQAHATNTYTTVATFAPGSGGTLAVTEWGLLTQAATGGGTLFDHQVFSAVNLVSGSDSLQSTYVLTLS